MPGDAGLVAQVAPILASGQANRLSAIRRLQIDRLLAANDAAGERLIRAALILAHG